MRQRDRALGMAINRRPQNILKHPETSRNHYYVVTFMDEIEMHSETRNQD